MKPIVVVGSINTDMVVRSSRLAGPGETLQATSFDVFTGGKGANQAAAAGCLGASVFMIGCVGNDNLGKERLKALQNSGVDTQYVRTVEDSSGVAVITVAENGENCILTIPGANAHVSPKDIEDHRELIVKAGIVLTQLETPTRTLEALAEVCNAHHVPLVLDPAPAQPLSAELLKLITWLTPNESEAEQLFHRKLADATEEDLSSFASEILANGPQNLILKLGSRGVFLATKEGKRVLIPAIPVSVVDTTAAGDAFNGAFASRLVEGDAPLVAARFAIAASALSVTKSGALPSMPKSVEVRTLLGKQ